MRIADVVKHIPAGVLLIVEEFGGELYRGEAEDFDYCADYADEYVGDITATYVEEDNRGAVVLEVV